MFSWLKQHRLLTAILVVSLGLRASLAFEGGQYYTSDEVRFDRGAAVYAGLRENAWARVGAELRRPEHTGFTYVSALLAPVLHGIGAALGHAPEASITDETALAHWAAVLLGLFSTLNVALVYLLARRAGAAPPEAEFAALLAAAAGTLFYYSRHLLPYDCSLAAALGALLLARQAPTWPKRLACGFFTGLSFEIYNGYWFLVPVIVLAVGWWQPDRKTRWAALTGWAGGFALALGAILLPGILAPGSHLLTGITDFSRTATQGDFAEGWSLPWAYLWHSEGMPGAATAGMALVGIALGVRQGSLPTRVRLWLGLLSAAYGLLVLGSTCLHQFVVYARTVRPLVPLICLVAAYGAQQLLNGRPRMRSAAIALVVAGAAANFIPHFTQAFPREVLVRTWSAFGSTQSILSYRTRHAQQPPVAVQNPGLVLVNAQTIFSPAAFTGYPAGSEIFSVPHPVSSPLHQYEGYTPTERALLRAHGADIRLIRLADPAPSPAGSSQP